MKSLYSTFLFLTAFNLAFAQSGKLKKADSFYERIAYAEAAELYSGLVGSEVDSPRMRARLADCYYQMGNTEKSEEVYKTVVETSEVVPEDIFNYAQSLKQNGKYSESDKWMANFHSLTSTDTRGKEFVSNPDYLMEIESQEAYFSLSHLSMNTGATEFGGYPIGDDKVYFVTNRKKHVAVRHVNTYNNDKFLDFCAGTEVNGALENLTYVGGHANKKYHEGPLCLSSDGNTVYFTRSNMSSGKNRRDNNGIQNLKIYKATLGSDGTWNNEKELSINSKDYSVGHPTLSADGKTLYFSSDMPGGYGGADIYKVAILEDGSLGTPENLGVEVNTEGQEMFPWITNEGWLFFASDGHVGLGGLDIFVMLPDQSGQFNKRFNVGKPVNSEKDDFALILNDDRKGYVSSNRNSGNGSDDIYSIQLLREFKTTIQVKGLITDMRSGDILPGASVNLIDDMGKVVATVIAGSKGEYSFDLEPESSYTVKVSNEKYFDNSANLSTLDVPSGLEFIEKNVSLEKDPGISLYALITDAKTKQQLEGVKIQLLDNMTGKTQEFTTGSSGDMRKALSDKKLGDRGSYNFTISKSGYLTKTITYNVAFEDEGQYDVHSALDLSLDPEVKDLRELVQINPINFDLGKWNIRQDAKVELDKIVEIMNKYPKMVVELGAHTDCRGSQSFNMKLSDKRAKSSAEYIKTKITNPERIYGKGYGESVLLNDCACEGNVISDCSDEEHEMNRRTEFKVISVGETNVEVKQ